MRPDLSDKRTKILIVGLGLMGGSYAMALSAKGYEVGAIDKDPAALDYARRHGLIRHGRTEPDPDYIGQFPLLIFALYPAAFLDWIEHHGGAIRHGALLTDVTGVKGCVADRVQEMLRDDVEYIGAHPMAGREVSGVENADKGLFLGANYIITPTEKNSPEGIAVCRTLGELLGFGRISLLSPREHDEMVGFLSQLTHCIAISLMVCKDTDALADYTGDSFRDLTRIAKINDRMWCELFLDNKPALLSQIDLFRSKLDLLRDYIAADDAAHIREMMRLSTARRTFFDTHKTLGGN